MTNLYEGFLQRGPDAGGLSFWTAQAGSTAQARQNVLNAFAGCDPFRELAGALYRETFWLVSDHLGTPRMISDRTGSLAGVKRHDYLPFGEELSAGAGGRTAAQGYGAADNVRQKFTKKERDAETSLDYFEARYYSSAMGRFTSPDEFTGGPDELYYFADDASDNPTFYADLTNPQSLNKYQYAYNNPLRYVDPDGHAPDGQQGQDRPPVCLPEYCTQAEAERRIKEWRERVRRIEEYDKEEQKLVPAQPMDLPGATVPIPAPSRSRYHNRKLHIRGKSKVRGRRED